MQELEAFASSDALPDLWRLTGDTQNQSLLSSLSVRGWRQLRSALDIKEEEGTERLCNRSSCAVAVVAAEKGMFGAQLSKIAEEPSAESGDQIGGTPLSLTDIQSMSMESHSIALSNTDLLEHDADAAALCFVNEWLGSIADSGDYTISAL